MSRRENEPAYASLNSGMRVVVDAAGAHAITSSPCQFAGIRSTEREHKGQSSLWAYGISSINHPARAVGDIAELSLALELLRAHTPWCNQQIMIDRDSISAIAVIRRNLSSFTA
jgi:hypothetical protein